MVTRSKPTYVTPHHIKETQDISTTTLRRWALSGKIRYITVEGTGRRLYHEGDVHKHLGGEDAKEPQEVQKVVILYSRVNDESQQEALARQKEELSRAYPNGEHTTDIASGLDWNRHGLTGILGRISKGEVETIVVSHRDRLARFGVELLEWIFRENSTKLVVLNKTDDVGCPTELQRDLLAVTTFLVEKNRASIIKPNSSAHRNRKGNPDTCFKVKAETNQGSEKDLDKMVRSSEKDVQPMRA
jgi:putative resolvase